MAAKLNFQTVLTSSLLYIFSSNLLRSVSAQDQFSFEFDRRCRNAVDCVFEPPGSSDRVYLDCNPQGNCACANYRLIADVPAWNLQWDPSYKHCAIAEMGPCGKDNLLEISCSDGLQCVKSRCRSPDRIANGRRGDWCTDDIDCEDGLKCSLVSFTYQPVRRCVDRMTAPPTTTPTTSSSSSPVPSVMISSTTPRMTQSSTMSTTTSTTNQPAGLTIIVEEDDQPPQNETTDNSFVSNAREIIDTLISTDSLASSNSTSSNTGNQPTQGRSSHIGTDGLPHIVEEDDLIEIQAVNVSPSNTRATLSNLLSLSIIMLSINPVLLGF